MVEIKEKIENCICGNKNYHSRKCKSHRRNLYLKVYNQQNKERILKKKKEWDKKNPEKVKKSRKEYMKKYNSHLETKEMRKEYTKKYNLKNKEKILKQQREYNQRPDVIKRRREWGKIQREKDKKDKEIMIRKRLRSYFRTMFRRYCNGEQKKFSEKYGIKWDKVVESLKPFPENLNDYQIDHIKPLCSFKFINKNNKVINEEIQKAWNPNNLQWLTSFDNISKGKKY